MTGWQLAFLLLETKISLLVFQRTYFPTCFNSSLYSPSLILRCPCFSIFEIKMLLQLVMYLSLIGRFFLSGTLYNQWYLWFSEYTQEYICVLGGGWQTLKRWDKLSPQRRTQAMAMF